jgi:hypothetical protein
MPLCFGCELCLLLGRNADVQLGRGFLWHAHARLVIRDALGEGRVCGPFRSWRALG